MFSVLRRKYVFRRDLNGMEEGPDVLGMEVSPLIGGSMIEDMNMGVR